ncbi:ComEA family DNA-binding protein [Kitasatospora sp. NPDC048722]|uniref:ComEA family DNA-binding protein n=1 Tax=Kitasatospora sp. NPDC048722 TaxID=3155639 RepID=UPI0033C02D79
MTSMGLGAAKRHEIDEAVRARMAAVLPGAGALPVTTAAEAPARAAVGAGAGAGAEEAVTTGPPPAEPASSVGTVGVPAGELRGEPRGGLDPVEPPEGVHRAPFRFGPAVVLDRRAVVGLAVLLLFAVGYAVQHFWLARPQAVAVPALTAGSGASVTSTQPLPSGTSETGAQGGPPGAAPPAVEPVVVVDVGGRVHTPGLHTLPGGSRVADALRVAGGPLPETDTRSLNLARVLTDGEQIRVGEPAPPPGTDAGVAAGPGPGPPSVVPSRQSVSLNRATLEQLDTLPGVGPTLAQRILAFRTSHGSFRTLDQLRQVSGIGARTYAELRPLLTL